MHLHVPQTFYWGDSTRNGCSQWCEFPGETRRTTLCYLRWQVLCSCFEAGLNEAPQVTDQVVHALGSSSLWAKTPQQDHDILLGGAREKNEVGTTLLLLLQPKPDHRSCEWDLLYLFRLLTWNHETPCMKGNGDRTALSPTHLPRLSLHRIFPDGQFQFNTYNFRITPSQFDRRRDFKRHLHQM